MNHKTLSLTLGGAIAASLSLAPVVHAAENPFAIKTLAAPSLVAEAGAKMKEGKCGEGKCGANKKAAEAKATEGKCGADKMKEAKCGANKGKQDAAAMPETTAPAQP